MLREAAERGLSSLKFLEVIVEAFTERSELNLTEMRALLCKCGFKVSDTELERLLPVRTVRFGYSVFLDVIKVAIQNCEQNCELDEIMNAFVALGGNPDRSGSVQKAVLINIIRKQFELTFNIQDFLDVTTDGKDLDFTTFSNIFAEAIERESQRSLSSRGSIRSKIGRPSIDIGEEGATSRLRYDDFEQWLIQNYN